MKSLSRARTPRDASADERSRVRVSGDDDGLKSEDDDDELIVKSRRRVVRKKALVSDDDDDDSETEGDDDDDEASQPSRVGGRRTARALESSDDDCDDTEEEEEDSTDDEDDDDDDDSDDIATPVRESVGESPAPKAAEVRAPAPAPKFTAVVKPFVEREPNVPVPRDIGGDSDKMNKPLRLKGKPGGPKFELHASLADRLYDHQIDGVRWMWSLHLNKRGGILADDMGMGKTLTTAAFVTGLLKSGAAKRVLVLADNSIVPQWAKEFETCGLTLGSTMFKYVGSMTQGERDRNLKACVEGRGVLLTSYAMAARYSAMLGAPTNDDEAEAMATKEGRGAAPANFTGKFRWDWIIADEGHKLKTASTQVSQKVRQLPVDLRLIVTGTPMGTDLGDLWALYDLTCPGLLGSENEFRRQFLHKINAGQSAAATQKQISEAKELGARLRQMTAPYYLRRDKSLFKSNKNADAEKTNVTTQKPLTTTTSPLTMVEAPLSRKDKSHIPTALGQKNDLIAWIPLEKTQRELYAKFCESKPVRDVMNKTGSAIACMNTLKKICDHPSLCVGGAVKVEDDDALSDAVDDDAHKSCAGEAAAAVSAAVRECGFDADALASGAPSCSAKMKFLMSMLERFKSQGHRALIFSQSQLTLDVIEKNVKAANLRFLRIDGKVTADERHRRVTQFQSQDDVPVMLLTARVGGMGLTLTAATRVIIYDPAWNPSMDNQSVDRAHRIGQHRDVVCYRLITCGSIEEKVYRKNVFKGGLSKSVAEGSGGGSSYFGSDDASTFDIDPAAFSASATMKELNTLHAADRKWTDDLRGELAYVQSLPFVCGVSDHDLLFSKDISTSGAGKSGSGGEAKKASAPAENTPKKVISGAAWKNVNNGWGGDGGILGVNLLAALSPAPKPSKIKALDASPEALSGEAKLRAKLKEHQSNIDTQNNILSMPHVANSLPDKGQKIREGIAALKAEMEVIQAEITAKYSSEESSASRRRDVGGENALETSPLETAVSLAKSIDELTL